MAFFSQKLLLRESRYGTIENECLAIVAWLKHFQIYRDGKNISGSDRP